MRLLPIVCISILSIAIAGSTFLLAESNDPKKPSLMPHVVIILADDLGYGDPHCYNDKSKIPTPNLDRMARDGLRFTDAHTPSSVCTPTRYGLLTGQYCWRTRLTEGVLDGFSPPLIPANRMTIASLLKQKGYATACLGKWHLGMQWTRKEQNTLIVFTSDNGGLWHTWQAQEADDVSGYKPTPRAQYTASFDHHRNASLRGTKADIYEGGHRVPFLIHRPAAVPTGCVVDVLVELTDLLATLADVTDQQLPSSLDHDSCSFAEILSVRSQNTPSRSVLVHHSLQGKFAIRKCKLSKKGLSGCKPDLRNVPCNPTSEVTSFLNSIF